VAPGLQRGEVPARSRRVRRSRTARIRSSSSPPLETRRRRSRHTSITVPRGPSFSVLRGSNLPGDPEPALGAGGDEPRPRRVSPDPGGQGEGGCGFGRERRVRAIGARSRGKEHGREPHARRPGAQPQHRELRSGREARALPAHPRAPRGRPRGSRHAPSRGVSARGRRVVAPRGWRRGGDLPGVDPLPTRLEALYERAGA